jgi:hypothetical protein
VVECRPSKHEALNSNLSAAGKKPEKQSMTKRSKDEVKQIMQKKLSDPIL